MTIESLRAALAERGPLLNTAQVAARLRVDRASVLRRYQRGTLPDPVAIDAKGAPLWLPEQYPTPTVDA